MSRSRFIDVDTKEDVYLYDRYTRVHYCLFCREHNKQAELYNLSEMIDHKFKVHCKAFVDDMGRLVRYETRQGHEIFDRLARI